jgi:uncharacterized NAD-dependent epimerase/dehydratase family protein
MEIKRPYLMFLGDAPDELAAKTAYGVAEWRPDWCVGQFRLPGCKADLKLKDMTMADAAAVGVKTVIIGVANRGGVFSDAWVDVLVDALERGMDLAAGLHGRLRDVPRLKAAAEKGGRAMHDVRHPTRTFPVGNGKKRTGRRILTTGTDVSSGKKYTALALEAEMKKRGMNVDFRATGQTGVLIAGSGTAIDAVVSDFISGAVETLAPENTPDHWDVIEGQGSLFHPSYSGVTMGLIHGAQPDYFVMCHEPTREHVRGLPHYKLPTLEECIEANLWAARRTNPAVKCLGISLNTWKLGEADALRVIAETEKRLGLPTVDSIRTGTGKLVDAIR